MAGWRALITRCAELCSSLAWQALDIECLASIVTNSFHKSADNKAIKNKRNPKVEFPNSNLILPVTVGDYSRIVNCVPVVLALA